MTRLVGTPAAPGMASGTLVRLEGGARSSRRANSPADERDAIDAAIASAQEALTLLCDRFGNATAQGAIERCLHVGLVRATDVERALVHPSSALEPPPLGIDLSSYDRISTRKDKP